MDIRLGGRLACIALASMLLIGMFLSTGTASAERAGDYIFTVADGEATVTGYTGEGGAIAIPSMLHGYPVVAIGDGAFASITSLTSVVIPYNVTSIGNRSFAQSGIVSISIPKSVAVIWQRSFADCSDLASIFISNGVERIGDGAFLNCTSLASAIIGLNVSSIGGAAFQNCSSLTSIRFLGLVAPAVDDVDWITGTPASIMGHAYASSDFPLPDYIWQGLTMGTIIQEPAISITVPDGEANPWYTNDNNFTATWVNDFDPSMTPIASIVVTIQGEMESRAMEVDVGNTSVNVSDIWHGVLPEGEYVIWVNVTDAADNWQNDSANFMVDTIGPTLQMNSPPKITNENHVRASWEVGWNDAGIDAVTLTMTEVAGGLDFGPFDVTHVTEAVLSDLIGSPLADGNWRLTLNATDFAGNYATIDYEFAVDTMAPNVSITTPTNGSYLNSTDVSCEWTASDNATEVAYFQVWSDSGVPINITGHTYSFNALTAGPHTLYVRAWDIAGNSQEKFVSIVVDLIGPEVVITFPQQDQHVGYGLVDATWTVNDVLSPIALVEVALDGNGFVWVGSNVSWQFDVPAGEHAIKVRAWDSAGNSGLDQVLFVADPNYPGIPENVTAHPGNAQIDLTWDPPSNDGGGAIILYNVYRSIEDEAFSLLNSTSSSPYTDGGLTNGLVYHYRISANNSAGEGAQSDEIFAIPIGPPTAPEIINAIPGNGQITLVWIAPTSNGGSDILKYVIYRGTTSGGESWSAEVGNALKYIDPGVTNGIEYYYKISANNSIIEGPQSNEVSAIPGTVPSAPQGLQAVSGDSTVHLNWTVPLYPGPGELDYYLFRDNVLIWNGTGLEYVDFDVQNGVTYSYNVVAHNSQGWGPNSTVASVIPFGVPSSPRGLVANPGNGNITLNWTAPSYVGPGSITYHVFRNGSLVWNGTALVYLDEGLAKNVFYSYNVSANNSIGWGINVSILASPFGVPNPPLGLIATPGDGKVSLTWNPSSYAGPGTLIYHLLRNDVIVWNGIRTTHDDSGLINGQSYVYKVAASNSVGWSANSSNASATPQGSPTAPFGLEIVRGINFFDLNWTAPNYTGLGPLTYHLFRDGALLWSGTGTSYRDASLTNGADYSYSIAAQNAIGWGNNCSAVMATAQGTPDAPGGLIATAGEGIVTLSWNPPGYLGPGTVRYHLFRNGSLLWSGSALEYSDLDVVNYVEYSYSVAAENSLGWGPNSTAVKGTPISSILPGAPSAFHATEGDGVVTLSWTAPASNGSPPIIGYKLYRLENSVMTLLAIVTTGTSYTDTAITNGDSYYYQVSAFNSVGEGQATEILSATPHGSLSSFEFGPDTVFLIGAGVIVFIVLVDVLFIVRKRRK